MQLKPTTTRGNASLGGSITWVVEVEADPEVEPRLIFKRNEMELSPGDKYTIEKNAIIQMKNITEKDRRVERVERASIQIKNITEKDFGFYELEGHSGFNRTTVTFKLEKIESEYSWVD